MHINICLKYIPALLLLCLLASCSASNAISYDVSTQEIKSCKKRAITDVTIRNENTNESYMIGWNGSGAAPTSGILKLYPLSQGYTIFFDSNAELQLEPDASYTITRSGGDRAGYKIKVYTDKDGLIYKTDTADCR